MPRITIKELQNKISELEEKLKISDKIYEIIRENILRDDDFVSKIASEVEDNIDIDNKIDDAVECAVDDAVSDLQVSR